MRQNARSEMDGYFSTNGFFDRFSFLIISFLSGLVSENETAVYRSLPCKGKHYNSQVCHTPYTEFLHFPRILLSSERKRRKRYKSCRKFHLFGSNGLERKMIKYLHSMQEATEKGGTGK